MGQPCLSVSNRLRSAPLSQHVWYDKKESHKEPIPKPGEGVGHMVPFQDVPYPIYHDYVKIGGHE